MHSTPKPPERWALMSLALSLLLTSIAVSIPNVALPTIAKEFGSSVAEAQRVVVAYLFAVTATIIPTGRLGDTLGRRKVLLIGIILYAVAAFLCAFAPSLWILVSARTLQGLGAAVIMSLSVASTAEISSPQKVGSSIGLLATLSAVGTAAGPTIGGVLMGISSWRCTFMLMAVLGLVSFYLVYRFLPHSNQKSIAHPLRVSTLQQSGLSSNLVMNAIVSIIMMSTLVIGPFYLSKTLGLDPSTIGFIMSIGPLISILSGVPSGQMVDRLGTSRVISIGLTVIALGASAFVILPSLFGMVGYMISSAILSPGYQLFQAANNTSAMKSAAMNERGIVSGLLSFSRNLGLMVGAAMMGSLYAHTSMEITFSIAIGLTAIALGIALKGKYETKLT